MSESYERARDHVLYFGFSSLCLGVFVVRISGSVLGDFATLRENHLFFSFCRAFFVVKLSCGHCGSKDFAGAGTIQRTIPSNAPTASEFLIFLLEERSADGCFVELLGIICC